MRLTWLGHACFLLSGSKTILIDPFIPEGTLPVEPDIVAVTHAHADHLGMTVQLGKKTVAVNEVAKYLAAKGLPPGRTDEHRGQYHRRRRPVYDDARAPLVVAGE